MIRKKAAERAKSRQGQAPDKGAWSSQKAKSAASDQVNHVDAELSRLQGWLTKLSDKASLTSMFSSTKRWFKVLRVNDELILAYYKGHQDKEPRGW